MILDVAILQEQAKDYDEVYELVKAAFAKAEHADHDEQELVVRLRRSAAFVPELSLVAVAEGKIVGHIMFTRVVIRQGDQAHESLTLAPLAVLPEYQRKGVGGRLIEAGHRAAQEIGFKSVLLVGHSTYYPRFGYQPAQRFGITTNLELPPDVFMACELVEGGFSGVTGRMALAPEFQLEMD
jgi:predicted N-acetyltransferase YhbS